MTDRGAKLNTANQQAVRQRALPKPLQQRTLEKVREVLKEAAKSRDGENFIA